MSSKLEILLNKIGKDLESKGFNKEEWKTLCHESHNYKDYFNDAEKNNTILSKSTGWTIYFSECHLNKMSRKSAADNWNILSISDKTKYENIAKKITDDKLVEWRKYMENMEKKSILQLTSQFDSPSEVLLLSKHDLQLMIGHLGYYMLIDSCTPKKLLQTILLYKLYGVEKAKSIIGTKYVSKVIEYFILRILLKII